MSSLKPVKFNRYFKVSIELNRNKDNFELENAFFSLALYFCPSYENEDSNILI